MWRNKTHRLTLAAAAAMGLAMVLVALSGVDLRPTRGRRPAARVQPLLYGILLVAFRHVVRVPAELRANWGIQMAWQGKARAFANGVQAAAMLSSRCPPLSPSCCRCLAGGACSPPPTRASASPGR